jgi:protein-L-isoaspartate O-methyltransferase
VTTDTTSQAAELLAHLADELADTGDLRTPAWRTAFLATPRHAFAPAFHQQTQGGAIEVTSDDAEWLPAVYSNTSLVTQITDGLPTSSSTQPSLMLRMLEALDVADGMRVLEIGTGTGYNAALLSRRLGDGNVTTVDVDGALGFSPGAPYDRVMATCAVRSLPAAWVEQLAPGGLVLATVTTGLHGSALALVGSDGRGRFLPERASFMPMRSHADPAFYTLHAQAGRMTGRRSTAFVPPLDDTAAFVLGLALPQVVSFGLPHGDVPGLYLAHRTDGSWAHALHDGRVFQGGPQSLWDQMEQAFADWTSAGVPFPQEFELTIDGIDQRVHTTDGALSYTLPSATW